MSSRRNRYLKKILGLLILLSLSFNFLRSSTNVNKNHNDDERSLVTWKNKDHRIGHYQNTSEILQVADPNKNSNNATIQEQQYYVPTLEELNSSISWEEFCKAVQKPNKEFSPFADKHAIKQWIPNVTPNLTFSKEYAFVDSPDDITEEFLGEKLPVGVIDKYLMKATHMSGGILLIDNQSNKVTCLKTACDRKDAKRKRNETTANYLKRRCQYYLNIDYATKKGEMSYANIPRRCLFEEVLDMGTNFQDYKLFMFHGQPYMVTIIQNRFDDNNSEGEVQNARKTPYTWKELPYEDANFDGKRGGNNLVPTRPLFMDNMIEQSKILYAKVQDTVPSTVHMRVDFFVYHNASNYAFAEITFAHSSCKRIFVEDVANQFYGYVATHPKVNVHPDLILDLQNMTYNDDKK